MTEYVIDKEIDDATTTLLANLGFTEFNEIREHEVLIKTCLKVTTDKNGENKPCKGDPVALKRVGQDLRPFCDADYVLVVDNSAWQEANEIKQQAIIHRGLMKINIDAKEGKIKIGTKKPDIVEFAATVHRFGAYQDNLLNLREALGDSARRFVSDMQQENE